MTTPKPDFVLITGIPGTGKTTYGNKLACQFGFAHHDLEEQQTLNRLCVNPTQFIADVVNNGRDAIVTWGFAPDDQPSVSIVSQFKSSGFKLIWFDGNRPAALREFQDKAKRKSHSEAGYYWKMHEFYLQMHRIEDSGIVGRINPVVIDSFDTQGVFKSTGELLAEIRRA